MYLKKCRANISHQFHEIAPPEPVFPTTGSSVHVHGGFCIQLLKLLLAVDPDCCYKVQKLLFAALLLVLVSPLTLDRNLAVVIQSRFKGSFGILKSASLTNCSAELEASYLDSSCRLHPGESLCSISTLAGETSATIQALLAHSLHLHPPSRRHLGPFGIPASIIVKAEKD